MVHEEVDGWPVILDVPRKNLRVGGLEHQPLRANCRYESGGDVAALYAGKLNPRNQRLSYLFEYGPGVKFNDSYISQDFQVSKVFRIRERVRIEGAAQVFNVLNISNLVGAAGLPSSPFNGTLTTIAAASDGSAPAGFKAGPDGGLFTASGDRVLGGVNRASGFGSLSAVRPSIPTGTGLPRAFQFGMRFSF